MKPNPTRSAAASEVNPEPASGTHRVASEVLDWATWIAGELDRCDAAIPEAECDAGPEAQKACEELRGRLASLRGIVGNMRSAAGWRPRPRLKVAK